MDFTPLRPVHPGEVLGNELRTRGIRQKDFCKLVGLSPTHLNDFVKGRRDMTRKLAHELEKQLGIPFSHWMRLHYEYLYNKTISEEQ